MDEAKASRGLWDVTIRFAGPYGETVTRQQVEADSEDAAIEIAELRGSRGHGRLIPVELIACERVGAPRKSA